MTAILFDSARVVKPARFARGVARRRFEPSAADQAWWAANAPSNATGYDVEPEPTAAEWERMAQEAEWQAKYEARIPAF